jgi:Ca-activated chloride channel family protein
MLATVLAASCALLPPTPDPVPVGPADPPPTPGGVLIADGGFGGQMDILSHTAAVTIHDGIAVTDVEQVFVNKEDRIVEALYIFPVPNGASVANFSMWIGGKEMIGEVVEKERARRIYESYKQTRRDPGLLEQVDFKTFEMRIFPIPAKAEQRIALSYYQEVAFDHDRATYVYPLATMPRAGMVQKTTGRFAITFEVLSESPITRLTSPSHPDDFVVSDFRDDYQHASLELTGGDLSRDVVLAYEVRKPKTGVDVVTSRPAGEDGYFMMTLTAGADLERPEQGSDYVFLLDISGSMASDGKLAMSRRSIGAFVEALAPEDRFDVITFNVRPKLLFGCMQDADPAARKVAAEHLATQEARGGTQLRPALETAYAYNDPDRPLNVVVLSDGMTEQTERQQLMQLIESRPPNARLFCVGVGNDVERPLLRRVAKAAGGFAAFVSREDDHTAQAAAFRRKVARPSATDVRLEFDGVEVLDLEPKQLPNLYHGLPIRIYGRFRPEAGKQGRVAMHATVAGREFRRDFDLDLRTDEHGGDPHIERMWAWHRIERLRHEQPLPRDEIVRLGEGYSIATEWTSFLVLENDAEFARWKVERRNLLRLPRDRARDRRLKEQLAAIRDQARPEIGPEAARIAARDAEASPARNATTPSTSSRDRSSRPARAPARRPRPSGGGGGIGAFDPVTTVLAVLLAALLLGTRRRGA